MPVSALATALQLAELGFSVFPCGKNKRPCPPHGFHDAVRDLTAVRELWRRYPGELVGVPTGAANNFDTLDIDPRHGGADWLARHGDRLPSTRTHRTRSGGKHFLFRHQTGIRNSGSKIAPGIDTRGEGGFIIWWPGHGGEVLCYDAPAPWPEWLVEVLIPPPAVSQASMDAPRPLKGNVHAERMAARVLLRLRTAPPGQRHHRLRAAARTLGGDTYGFSKAHATRSLLDAVLAAGGAEVSQQNALGTIAWGLEKGRQTPLIIGGGNA
jgi:hypothetical protein